MPMKKQAVRISSVRSAAKGSVKAKKVVSVSYGYGSSRKSGHGYGNGTKHGYGHKAKYGFGHKTKQGYGHKKSNGCGHKAGYGHSQDSDYGHGAGTGHGYGHESGCGYGHRYGSSKKNSGYGGKQEKSKSDHACKHVKSDCGCTPVKKVCKPVKYVCKPVKSVSKKTCKKAVVARRSAFRAVSAEPQAVAAAAETQVIFGLEQFDLGGEYNPLTSTFRPRQNGIYTIVASVFFTATELADIPTVFLALTVNNNIVAAETATLASRQVTLDVTTIVRLRSGDAVRVEFGTNQAGVITFGGVTHFEGVLNRVTN